MLHGYRFQLQSPPEGKSGSLWMKDSQQKLKRVYIRLLWPDLTICEDADDDDGRNVACLERGIVRKRPRLNTKHQGKRLYCFEICHKRGGIMEGGGGLLYAESADECDEWFRVCRRHSGHHSIENVFHLGSGAIGTGAYSRVLGGSDKTCDGQDWPAVALKILEKCDMKDEDMRVLQEEIRVHEAVNALHAPFCLRMKEWFEVETQFVIVMEHMSGGELFKRLRLHAPSFPEIEIQAITKQLLTGLRFLHQRHICHKDIKPENVLLTHDQAQRRRPVECRIADFGIAAYADPANPSRCFKDPGDIRCSPGYGAPEVIRQEWYGLPADIWSLGVLLYIMLAGVEPFVGKDELETRRKMLAAEVDLAPVEKEASAAAVDLLSKMLVVDMDKRITAAEALAHPWITALADPEGPALKAKPSFWFADKLIARRFAFFRILWIALVASMLLALFHAPLLAHPLALLAVVAVHLRKDWEFQYFEFLQNWDDEHLHSSTHVGWHDASLGGMQTDKKRD